MWVNVPNSIDKKSIQIRKSHLVTNELPCILNVKKSQSLFRIE
jgi:hypothetical protein